MTEPTERSTPRNEQHERHADSDDRDMGRLRKDVAEIGERQEAIRTAARTQAMRTDEQDQRREAQCDQDAVGSGVQLAQTDLPASHMAALMSCLAIEARPLEERHGSRRGP